MVADVLGPNSLQVITYRNSNLIKTVVSYVTQNNDTFLQLN